MAIPLTAETRHKLREMATMGYPVNGVTIIALLDALDAREAQTCDVICPSCGAKIAERE